ncbi:MAG: prolipoprotein diacylglyceryl transferase [Chitinispirillaceae bacterium]
MHPVLFKIFSFPVPAYGMMLALSFLFGIWLGSWRAKKAGLNPDVISDVGLYVILSAILGSRLYYVILHFEEFQGNLMAIINPFHGGSVGIGGLVMYGGFIGAIIAGALFFKLKKLPFLPYADASAPSIGFGIFLTRIGCFLNGCCYGAAAEEGAACSVSFPPISPAGDYQQHVHASGLLPSQLFESVGGLIIGIVVLLVGRKKPFAGLQFYLVGLLYSVLRFMVDFSRVYMPSEKLGPLSHNQVVCIFMFIVFGGLILRNYLNREVAPQPAVDSKQVESDEPSESAVGQK